MYENLENSKQVLGFDPATLNCGFSILEFKNRKINYIYSEQKKLQGKELEERFHDLYISLDYLLIKYPNISEIAIEETFVDKDFTYGINSPLKLSMARGVMYAVAGKHNKKCYEYNNKKIKTLVCQDVNAKHGMMIRRVSKIIKKPVQDDEAFAIAIGITHILTQLAKSESKSETELNLQKSLL